jgi:hypothetical protein
VPIGLKPLPQEGGGGARGPRSTQHSSEQLRAGRRSLAAPAASRHGPPPPPAPPAQARTPIPVRRLTCVCPVTRMSQSSLRCSTASASRSPQGTTWWPWQRPTRKSPMDTTCGAVRLRGVLSAAGGEGADRPRGPAPLGPAVLSPWPAWGSLCPTCVSGHFVLSSKSPCVTVTSEHTDRR